MEKELSEPVCVGVVFVYFLENFQKDFLKEDLNCLWKKSCCIYYIGFILEESLSPGLEKRFPVLEKGLFKY